MLGLRIGSQNTGKDRHMPPNDLQTRLLAAHASNDRPALIELYLEASETAETEDASGFYLTHAYVFALEAGDPRARGLKSRLTAMKRDV